MRLTFVPSIFRDAGHISWHFGEAPSTASCAPSIFPLMSFLCLIYWLKLIFPPINLPFLGVYCLNKDTICCLKKRKIDILCKNIDFIEKYTVFQKTVL